MATLFTALRALLYMTCFLGLFAWLALKVRAFDAWLGGGLPAWLRVPAVILMLGGAALALACVGAFVLEGKGTPAPFDAPRRFVAVGAYRYVRNPMYVGGLGLLAGFSLYNRSLSMLLFLVVVCLVVHAFVVFYEEPTLRATFGAEYENYCRSVSRWLPKRPT